MKKIILLLIAIVLTLSIFIAASASLPVGTETCAEDNETSLQTAAMPAQGGVGNYSKGDTSNIRVTLTAGEYNITKDESGLDVIQMDGFSSTDSPGDPMLVHKVYNVIVPPDVIGSSLQLKVVSAEINVLEGTYDIKPAGPDIAGAGGELTEDWGEGKTIVNGRNTKVYGTNANYPENYVELLPYSQMRKWKFAKVDFTPFQYNPVSKKLTLIESVVLEISYNQSPAELNERLMEDTSMDDTAAQISINYEEAKGWYEYSTVTPNAGNGGSVSVTLNAGQYTITKDGRGLDVIQMEGFSSTESPGDPMLVHNVYDVLVPPDAIGSSLQLEIVSAEISIIEGTYDIKPVGPDVAGAGGELTEDWGEGKVIVNGRNIKVYGTNANYPENYLQLLPYSQMRKWKFAKVDFIPFQYNPVSRKLTLIESVVLKISYTQSPAKLDENLMADTVMDDIAPQIFLNYDEASDWYEQGIGMGLPGSGSRSGPTIPTPPAGEVDVEGNLVDFEGLDWAALRQGWENSISLDILHYGPSTEPPRLTALGATVTSITNPSVISEAYLNQFDVFYVGYAAEKYYGSLASKATAIRNYISGGGGVILEQPSETGYQCQFLPAGFGVTVADTWWPEPRETEFTSAGQTHSLLQGLTPDDMSGNFDTVYDSDLGSSYTRLARLVSYPNVIALAVGQYGSGRIVFHTGNIGTLSSDPGSDTYVEQMLEWAAGGAGVYDYVIITTNAIEASSTKLASFITHKQSLGHTVLVVTEDDFGSLTGQAPNHKAEKIRQWLKNNYVSKGIEYVLLIGDPHPYESGEGDIPMKMCWPRSTSSYDTPTDYFYADLTGNWDKDGDGYYGEWGHDYPVSGGVDFSPEVYVGRIPVYSAAYTTLDNILQKIIDYETAGSVSWRKSILMPMGFQSSTGPYDGAMLGEQMRDYYLNANSYTSWRMYQQGNGTCGLDSNYTSEQELRGGTVVRTRWAANDYGIVSWWGHGSATSTSVGYSGCWDGTLFQSSYCSSLDDNHPSFTYQCSCTNGYPENSDNLQYAILKRGGIGTVSATRVSWFNTGVVYGDFDGSTTNSGIGYEYVDRLVQELPGGDALYQTKQSMSPGMSTRLMNWYDFNLYGDPEVSLKKTQPVAQEDYGVFRNGVWCVDTTGNHIADLVFGYGIAGDVPVVGDFPSYYLTPSTAPQSGVSGGEYQVDYSQVGNESELVSRPSEPISFRTQLAPNEIAYDDGVADEGWAWTNAGGERAVRFTPLSYPVDLKTAKINIWPNWPDSDHEEFGVVVYDDDGTSGAPGTQLGQVFTTATDWGWHDVDISGLDITITSGDFYIAYLQLTGSPNCEALSADTTSPDGRSWKRWGGGSWSIVADPPLDWMIRAIVETGGDGELDDYGVFRNGIWCVDTTGNHIADLVFGYGIPGDIPLVGDIDQDGTDDIAIFRNGIWCVDTTGNHVADLVFGYGIAGDVPIVGDINKDGSDDIGIFRNGMWCVDTTGNHVADLVFGYGIAGDVPLVGDINRDGSDDIGIFRNGMWCVDTTGNHVADLVFGYGIAGDVPLVGDIG